jgi:hypothetical protein
MGVGAEEKGSAVYLPFWRIRVKEMQLQSYADLVTLVNMPKAPRKEWESAAFHFWMPAFKVNPQLFLRSAKGMTLAQPQDRLGERMPATTMHPVTLPLSEAAEGLRIILATLSVPGRALLNRFPLLDLAVEDSLLVYLPFMESGSEFIQPEARMAISKNALRWGRCL